MQLILVLLPPRKKTIALEKIRFQLWFDNFSPAAMSLCNSVSIYSIVPCGQNIYKFCLNLQHHHLVAKYLPISTKTRWHCRDFPLEKLKLQFARSNSSDETVNYFQISSLFTKFKQKHNFIKNVSMSTTCFNVFIKLFLTQTRVAKSINFWEYGFELCKKFPQNIVNPVWPVVERVDR